MVYQEASDSQSPTHSRPAECGSRQAIQARPDHPDRVVPPNNMQQVAKIDLFATRFNKLPLFVSPIPDPLALAVDALSLSWEDLEAYAQSAIGSSKRINQISL